ncbi:MAG TPA: hypothetical protein DCP63_03060 [Bacteroidetes bacterium]|nr:hypothetical protein [Bacteroidota bacterium]
MKRLVNRFCMTFWFPLLFQSFFPSLASAQVTVSLPNVTGAPSTTMTIPITVSDLTGKGVTAFDVRIRFDSTVAKLTGIDRSGTISESMASVIANTAKPDTLIVVAAGISALSGSGTLINVTAELRSPGLTSLTFYLVKFNEGTPSSTSTNGSIRVNRKPTINQVTPKSVNEGQPLTFTVSATDPDGDLLTYSSSNLPSGATLGSSTGAFSWTPGFTQSGSYSVVFKATDPASSSDSTTALISVVNVNQKPVITAIAAKTVAEGSALNFSVVATDPDNDVITYGSPNLPTGATLSASTGSFSWTPGFAQAGSYSVTFTATDPGLLSDSTVASITVTNVNQKPTIASVSAKSVAEGTSLNFNLSATDPDGDPLTFSSSTSPTGASLSSSTGAFNWTPSFTQSGSYSILFRATDSGGLSDSTTASITVTNVNRKPAYVSRVPTSVSQVSFNTATTFRVSASDPDGDALTFVWKVNGATEKSGADSTFTKSFPGPHGAPNAVTAVFSDPGGLKDSTFWNFTITGVSDGDGLLPTEFSLGQNFPNPFNPITSLSFALPKEEPVTLEVYNMLGVKVRTLIGGGTVSAGFHTIAWDGTNDAGVGVPSGVYLYRIHAGLHRATKKMTLMK